ncbi:MAG: hypothetical protein FWF92_05325 [Oscillospiraceae bacterium]|nr:hypothetical protein [Oscillospiraceae bacterium]
MSVKKFITKSLNIIFPVKCVCCKKISARSDSEDILCESCRKILIKEAAHSCRICGNAPYLCECKKINYIDKLVFPYFYSGDKLKQAIYAVKQANLYYINEFFAKDMYNSLKLYDKIKINDIDFITNTPRMKSSIKFYGYNQTAVLAKIISEYTGIYYKQIIEASSLYDREQKSLDKTQRVLNVTNKFTLVKNIRKNKENIKGKNILIIDDIVTTGSTLSECARILKNIGAKSVCALCAASVFSQS